MQNPKTGSDSQAGGNWEGASVDRFEVIDYHKGENVSEFYSVIREELKDKLRQSRLAPEVVLPVRGNNMTLLN